jgi:hypothetical protein
LGATTFMPERVGLIGDNFISCARVEFRQPSAERSTSSVKSDSREFVEKRNGETPWSWCDLRCALAGESKDSRR